MRVAIICDQGAISPPPDQMPMLLEAMRQWRGRWRNKMEVFGFWAGAPGGFGLVNMADETELAQFMMEFPFGPFSNIQVRPFVDGDSALEMLMATTKAMLSQLVPA